LSHSLRQRQVVALTLAEAARHLRGAPADRVEAVISAAHQATAASHSPQVRTHPEAFQRLVDTEVALGTSLDALVHTLHDLSFGDAPDPAVSELLRQRHALQGQIIFAAQVYNDTARHYNDALQVFPTTVVAKVLHFGPAPAFLHGLTAPTVLITGDAVAAPTLSLANPVNAAGERDAAPPRPGDLI